MAWSFPLENRVFHVGLDAKRQEITLSTPVFFTDEAAAKACVDLVADFNAYHLFHGGYRLRIDPGTHYVYASQTKSLARAQASGLAVILDDFGFAMRDLHALVRDRGGKPSQSGT